MGRLTVTSSPSEQRTSPVSASVSDTHSTELAEPDLMELLEAPPWSIPVRKDRLSQVDGSVWHPNPELWSLHVWPLQGYQRRWRLTVSRTRHAHGSTSTLYKMFVCFKVFVKWCGQAHIDPVTCTVSDVLSFLQYRLDSGSLTSTLEVYVAAITAFRSPQTVITPWWWVFLRERKD